MNSCQARGSLRWSWMRVGEWPISSAIAGMPRVRKLSAMPAATVGHVSRSPGAEPEPVAAATTALTRSGWASANCRTA